MTNHNYRTNQKSLIMSSNTKRKINSISLSLSSDVSLLLLKISASLCCISLIIPSVYGNCPVLEQERCDFTYKLKDPDGDGEDKPITSCTDTFVYESSGCSEDSGCSSSEYYCPLTDEFDGQKTWGVCNGGCFEDEEGKQPKDFSNDLVAATFCKIRKTTCIFPFTYKGEVHNSCIQKEDTFWCATDVNEQNEVIDGFWGKCDVEGGKTSCDPNWKPKPEQQTNIKSKVAIVKIIEGDFPSSGVTALIEIKQDKEDVIRITGSVQGLPPTNSSKYGLHVHEHPISDNDCMTAGTHFNPLSSEHGAPGGILGYHIGDLGNIEADENGVAVIDIILDKSPRPTLYEGDTSILGRTLVIHGGEDDLSSTGDKVGNAGKRIACGVISEKVDEGMALWILIIILAVVIFFVIAILICLICYCKSKTVVKEKLPQGCNGVPDPVDMNGYKMNGKKALFDELSIPFIDASPGPSPKPGRSTDRLSFFHRSSSAVGSRGSLSGDNQC